MIPNYKENNTINLLSSLLHGLGNKSKYPELNKNLTEEIKKAKNVILLIIDGLGSDSLKKLSKKSFLVKKKSQDLQSVFPSTTASAITSFYTGLAPKEHGVTGWYMNMKEFGAIVCLLPFITRQKEKLVLTGRGPYLPEGIKIKMDYYNFLPKDYFKSQYNKHFGKGAKEISFKTFTSMLTKIQKLTKENKKKYIYAYWPEFDSLCHEYGKTSKEAKEHLKELNLALEKFAKKLKGTNTLLLITADHGQVVTSKKRTIVINKHPLLKECLSAPLCGEPRAAYCYVYPNKVQQFEKYIKHKFKKQCTLYKSEELIKEGYFGLGNPHLRLKDRLGDYVLIAKDNYIFRDFLINEEIKYTPGHHGGTSSEEMVVPLIKIK
ncbi:hypothetical protein HOC13_02825 [Candidatus Woesearchaeota archaeon]|jgi:hypothetical protein|nr:hypothetical protein [Candidatus Woesearchaeota archaeon]